MSQSIEEIITIEGPKLSIDLGTSSPHGGHAKHHTTGDRVWIPVTSSLKGDHANHYSNGDWLSIPGLQPTW